MVSLLHHHHDLIPFEDTPGSTEAYLRAQIGRLTAERRDLLGLIERQRVEHARLEAELHRLRHELAHMHRQNARRWWQR